MIDLRLGRYQDVLGDVECDLCCGDPPYGKGTHDGHDAAVVGGRSLDKARRNKLEYAPWSPAEVAEYVAFWAPRTRGWMVNLTSHDLIEAWRDAYSDARRCPFAPVPCVIVGMTVRLCGDGPSSWAVYAMVSRPRAARYSSWGTLPGAYVSRRGERSSTKAPGIPGGKPIDLMLQIVRDYSNRGDVVCDPTAGMATTLLAAETMGRQAIGAEMDPDTHRRALERIAMPSQGSLLALAERKRDEEPEPQQQELAL